MQVLLQGTRGGTCAVPFTPYIRVSQLGSCVHYRQVARGNNPDLENARHVAGGGQGIGLPHATPQL